ncbi:MAG: glycine/betaine ABC transporter substrate-binding protein [Spirochaetia bacterium]|nr:glycine/betaine ABC transporter substrate-binding protein [Spirochaetia bacterium]
MKRLILILVSVGFLLCFCGCSDDNVIRIAHKNYTEQRIAGQMLAILLEDRGYKTKVSELGGSMLCFNALRSNKIDLYPEYTSTMYSAFLNQTERIEHEKISDYVRENMDAQFGITMLSPFGWNNTYTIAVTSKNADKQNLKDISDIVPLSESLIIGSDSEFVVREDGLIGMQRIYGIKEFKKTAIMDSGLMYNALVQGDVDTIAAFSTDGRLAKYNLVTLEDDKKSFMPFYCVPILDKEFAQKNPEIVAILEETQNRWTNAEMQQYNLRVDEGEDVRNVARQMLIDKGL